MSARVHVGRVEDVELDGMFHAILCDPPYELGFMGKAWDASGVAFRPETWRRLAEHLLPGGHLLAFGGTRTYHRLACAIEDAGFEIRDSIAWMYGSGFPKSLDVGKVIDKAAGAEREVVGVRPGHEDFAGRIDEHSAGARREGWDRPWKADPEKVAMHHMATAPATAAARQWDGYGTALKPAYEPVVVARKPVEGTVAANCLAHGAGALNVDGCRVGSGHGKGNHGRGGGIAAEGRLRSSDFDMSAGNPLDGKGRWPANVLLSHAAGCVRTGTRRVKAGVAVRGNGNAGRGMFPVKIVEGSADGGYADADGLETVESWECVVGCPGWLLDEQSGERPVSGSARNGGHSDAMPVGIFGARPQGTLHNDAGGASRFFYRAQADQLDAADPFYYHAKASRRERDAGLEGMLMRKVGMMEDDDYDWARERERGRQPRDAQARNVHPTVKPIDLARYLAKLILSPPLDVPRRILVPFAGVGSEMIGALLAGWDEVVGIEMDAEYADLAERRIAYWTGKPRQTSTVSMLPKVNGHKVNGHKPSGQLLLWEA